MRDALRVSGVSAGYGHVGVLKGVSMHVAEGEAVTLIGSNGAGKTTLLRALVGLVRPSAGSVSLFGEEVTGAAPEKLVSRGLALVPEGRMLFGSMSVRENLALGAYTRGGGPRTVPAGEFETVCRLFPVLRERLGQAAATLSGGEQQMLAVARALMSRPKVLLLDEPSLGLAPKVIAQIFDALDELRRDGLTILLVEQDAKLALSHCDRGYVMRTGSVVLEGTSDELLGNDDVRLIYLGAWHGKDGE